MFWLIILYVFGAVLRTTDPSVQTSSISLVLLIAILTTITYILFIYVSYYSFFDIEHHGTDFFRRITLNNVGIALLAVTVCASIRVPERLCSFLQSSSSSTFAGYLIHEQPLFRRYSLTNRFTYLVSKSLMFLLLY